MKRSDLGKLFAGGRVIAFALTLFACRDMLVDAAPRHPAAVAVTYSVSPAAAEAASSAAPDQARIQLLRGTNVIYDQVHPLPPGETETRVRIQVDLQGDRESLMLVLQLMEGAQVVFSGSQPVVMNRGETAMAEMVVSIPVATVQISPRAPTVNTGATTQLSAATFDAAGNVLADRAVAWASSDISKATVSNTGLVTGVAAGSAFIVAASEGKRDSVQVTVTRTPAQGTAVSVNSQPAVEGQALSLADSITVVTRVTAGADTVRAIRVERPEGGDPRAPGWLGFYSVPIAPGETREITIRTATAPAGSYPLLLVAYTPTAAVTLDTIQVQLAQSDATPPTVSIVSPADGSTVTTDTVALRFTATDNRGVARFRASINGNTRNTVYSHTASATYDSGVWDRFVVQPGRNVITLTVFDVGLNATTDSVVFFRAAPVASVAISPSSATVAVGATQQCSATLRDAQGNTLTGRTVTWTSSNTGVATVSATGLATVTGSGTATITATSEGVSGTASITGEASAQLVFGTVTAGNGFSCGLTRAGKAYCWGSGTDGKLGDGTGASRGTPTAVQTDLTFTQIRAGANYTVALTTGGQAYAWGYNANGELGDGTTTNRLAPTAVQTSLTFAQISAGLQHTVALTPEGRAYAWGFNAFSQLGDGTSTSRLTPTAVQTNLTFTQVSAGLYHTAALTSEGQAYAWGFNARGALGDGTTENRLTPTAVQTSLTFTQISAGREEHTVALTTQGQAYAWGRNARGELGDGTTPAHLAHRLVPTAVQTNLTFTQISAGRFFTLALTGGGQAYAWGRNDYGLLGDGSTTDRLTPVAVQTSATFTQISAGGDHNMALTAQGQGYGWGSNDSGAVGDGTGTDRYTPTRVRQ